MKKIEASFRGIGLVLVKDIPQGTYDLDFDGHYLIELDKDFKPTGKAVDHGNNPISFGADEIRIEVTEL